MPTIVYTRPLLDRQGRRIRDSKKLGRLVAHGYVPLLTLRRRCRVCNGAGCHFCREGQARWICGDCLEALPCCSCFGALRRPRGGS